MRWRRVALAAAAVVAVGLAVVAIAFVRRSTPEPVSMDRAVQRFRSTGDDQIAPGPRSFGVYEARGEGENHVSAPPSDQVDSATMPVTVAAAGRGCWTWRIDHNSAHHSELELCRSGSSIAVAAQRTRQSWDWGVVQVDNLTEYRCRPSIVVVTAAGEPPDQVRSCTGSSSALDGETTVEIRVATIGVEPVRIDGEEVPAIHQRWDQTLTGAQTGDLTEDWWFATEDGLPLQATRSYRLQTRTPIGTTTYREDGSWSLASLAPRR